MGRSKKTWILLAVSFVDEMDVAGGVFVDDMKPLQEKGETEKDTAEDSSHAHTSTGQEGNRCCTGIVWGAGGGSTAKARDRDLIGSRGTCGLARGRRRQGGIAFVRALSTAGMIGAVQELVSLWDNQEIFCSIPALVLAGVVAVAVVDTVTAPLLADVEGECLRVLGDVGRDAVLADARVGQGLGVAVVVASGQGVDTRLLGADEWALCLVLVTPVFYEGSVASVECVVELVDVRLSVMETLLGSMV